MRFYQYLPWLERAGISVVESPLFSDHYVRSLQSGQRRFDDIIRAYTRRVTFLLRRDSYDLIWIEKELFPWLPVWIERFLLSGSVPFVLDYDDAVFHYYDQHRNPLIRLMLGKKHPSLMRSAALVVAGNDYLAEYARASGAKFVEVLPTVVDLERYPNSISLRLYRNVPPVVGWIGQRSTADFLHPYEELFRKLTSSGVARFVAIGIDARAHGLTMDSVTWSEGGEAESIAGFDIGIMPLVDGSFERGKCGYKLIQYMACGLPVVASPVGVNRQIVEHGINGFLADSIEEWRVALDRLLADQNLRLRMGKAGREKVERIYTLQKTGPMLASLLHGAAKKVIGQRNNESAL